MTGSGNSSIAERKQELRRMLRARRREIYGGDDGAALRAQETQRLLAHAAPLRALVESLDAPLVAVFHPTPTEADVMPLAAALAAAGARLVFPAASAGEQLEWISWDGRSPFRDSPGRGFGQEPDGERLGAQALRTAALVLAPALAVDRSGTRLGHGAGYYDRALTTVPAGARVVAVINPGDLLEAGTLPRDAHDVPISEVLTSDGLVSLVTSERR